MSDWIVVTGAAGFIGRNVVAELNARGLDRLLLVDSLGHDDKWKNLVGLRFEDLIQPATYLDQIKASTAPNARAIIHLGACSATTEKDADYLLENNYRYTRTLCEWALNHDSRFVYASSAATYGDGGKGYSDADAITPTLQPLNMYGYSKHLFDLWALRHGLFDRIVGLKYFNVYGPYETHKGEMRSVIHRSFEQITAVGSVKLFKSYKPEYGDGQQKRDFIYVKDAVDVTLHFALNNGPGGLYNCGTGQSRTWLDLAHATFAALGKPPNVEFIDMPATLKDRYQYFTEADAAKLRRQGGYDKPFATLEAGVKDYVERDLRHLNA